MRPPGYKSPSPPKGALIPAHWGGCALRSLSLRRGWRQRCQKSSIRLAARRARYLLYAERGAGRAQRSKRPAARCARFYGVRIPNDLPTNRRASARTLDALAGVFDVTPPCVKVGAVAKMPLAASQIPAPSARRHVCTPIASIR